MTPHTTRKDARECADCHRNPKTLGLGEGNLQYDGHRWNFTPVKPGKNYEIAHPLDSCINIEGQALVNFSREWLRCFNKDELNRILKVGLCLGCHRGYDDKVMKEWEEYKDFDCRRLK